MPQTVLSDQRGRHKAMPSVPRRPPKPPPGVGAGSSGSSSSSQRLPQRAVLWGILAIATLYSVSTLMPGKSGPQGAIELGRRGLPDIPLSNEQLAIDLADVKALLREWPEAKPKAAFFLLTRNQDLDGVLRSISMLEKRFNAQARYPYVFVNDQRFSERFRLQVLAQTGVPCFFGQVPPDHWSYPAFINQTRAAEAREALKSRVPYGGSESYRFMCRYFSGFFFHHPLLEGFDYYWRVEPNVKFFCDMSQADPFVTMRDRNLSYGFNIAVNEVPETIPSLWPTVTAFLLSHLSYVAINNSALPFMTDAWGRYYNGCHFWSNFEIGALAFFRSRQYSEFFQHLDHSGGFFYERWGDAPVHSLAAAALLPREAIHLFNGIGYQHDDWVHCPQEDQFREICGCDPKRDVNLDQSFCLKQWKAHTAEPARPLTWLTTAIRRRTRATWKKAEAGRLQG